MEFRWFSRNGEIRPIAEAVVPLSNIEYQYGFGVYETIRVREGVLYFPEQHLGRLMESARIIGLKHSFDVPFVSDASRALTEKIGKGTYNLKIVLIGPSTSLGASGQAELDIIPLNPHFPDKKLYRDGVHCITYRYERFLPHAKTLNMFRSYLAYAEAKKASAYDALFVDMQGNITEGTRTNFFCLKGKTLFSPPFERILLGITRAILLKVAKENGFEVVERDIPRSSLKDYDSAFITSTSIGIMPIASVDSFTFGPQPAALKELMAAFDSFIERSGGTLK